jgi:hypothetical protein
MSGAGHECKTFQSVIDWRLVTFTAVNERYVRRRAGGFLGSLSRNRGSDGATTDRGEVLAALVGVHANPLFAALVSLNKSVTKRYYFVIDRRPHMTMLHNR